jgi:hypothetical protein
MEDFVTLKRFMTRNYGIEIRRGINFMIGGIG